jgi:hypothetical protein
MLAIDAVRSSAEIAQIEAYDYQQEKLEQQSKLNIHTHDHAAHQQTSATMQSSAASAYYCTSDADVSFCHGPHQHQSLTHHIRRSMSLPGNNKLHQSSPTEIVDTELARSLFQKTHLTDAQKRRLSIEILSQVEL